MKTQLQGHVPILNTAGRIASKLGVPLHRVLYVLATRPHITPGARAGTLRLYDLAAVAMIRHELSAIDARRAGKGCDTSPLDDGGEGDE